MPLTVVDQVQACTERGVPCEVQYPVIWERTFLTGNLEKLTVTMKTHFATHQAAERFLAAIKTTPVTRTLQKNGAGKRNSVLDSNPRIL